MPALTFDGHGNLRIVEQRDAAPRKPLPPGEARIRLRLAGICRTDLEIVHGYLNFSGVLGHEFVGDVIESSDPSLQGARVVGEINCGCTRCDACNRGLWNHCARRTVLGIHGRDGVFQDTFCLPVRNLHRVPEQVPDEHAVFTEPLAAACRLVEQVEIPSWERVAVLGDGKLGILCALVLAHTNHSVALFGHHPGRIPLPVAVEEKGPPQGGESGGERRDRYDVVVEATGATEGFAVALGLVQPLGKLILKSTCAAPHHLSLAPVVVDEITVVGSRCGPFKTALQLLKDGDLPLHALVERRFPLAEGVAAMAAAAAPGARKILLEGTGPP